MNGNNNIRGRHARHESGANGTENGKKAKADAEIAVIKTLNG